MEKHIIDEKTGIPYTLVGDYYLPWGDLPDEELEQRPVGIWGQRHLRYIKQNKRILYSELLTSGKLNSYLADLNDEAEKMFSCLIKQMTEKENFTENLKGTDQMLWVQSMNSIRKVALEIVQNDLIYQ